MNESEILFLFIISLLAWIAVFSFNLSEIKNSKSTSSTIKKSKIELSPESSAHYAIKVEQKSLDSLYAESHGMLVCKYCQTLNESSSIKCAACGKKIP